MSRRRVAIALLVLSPVLSVPVDAKTCLDYRTVDPADPPPLRAVVPLPGPAWDVDILAGHAYLACGVDGLRILELEDPDHPHAVGHLGFGGASAMRVVAYGCQAYVATGQAVEVVDITSAAAPAELRRLAVGQEVTDVDAADERVAATTAAGSLFVWPAGPCSLPGPAAAVELGETPRRVAIGGRWAFAATAAGLTVVDLGDAGAPTVAARLDPSTAVAAVAVWGDTLVAVCATEMRIYTPLGAGPRLVRRIAIATAGVEVAAADDEIHLLAATTWAVHSTGFHQLRLPVGNGVLPAAATGLALAGPGVFFAAGGAGFVVGWRQCAIEPPVAVPAGIAGLHLRAVPNPANPRVRLQLAGSRTTKGVLAVHDLRGRLVAVLPRGESGPGLAIYTWDGRGRDGRPQPSGRYVACWRAPGERAAVSFVLLR